MIILPEVSTHLFFCFCNGLVVHPVINRLLLDIITSPARPANHKKRDTTLVMLSQDTQ